MTTKTTKHQQTNNEPTFFCETEHFPFLKNKQVLSDSNPGTLTSQAYSLRPDQVCQRHKEIRIN